MTLDQLIRWATRAAVWKLARRSPTWLLRDRRRRAPLRKPRARAMTNAEALRQEVLRLYRAHLADGMLPSSARFLFYELVAAGVISKHATGARRADQNLIDALTQLRDKELIPWNAIVDETRSLDDLTGWSSIAEGVNAYLTVIRLDPWDGDAPLLVTESRSLAGVLRELTQDYRAMIAPTNGQCAGFLHNVVAPRLTDGACVLYLGDFDLAGADIENNTRSVLERYHSLEWERLALTAEQVATCNLPSIGKSDRRFKNGGAHEAVEAEALSQRLIVQIVRDRLDELLAEQGVDLNDVHEREAEQRRRVAELLAGMP
jgi:hypothetical protein